jgi:hypothetical protein
LKYIIRVLCREKLDLEKVIKSKLMVFDIFLNYSSKLSWDSISKIMESTEIRFFELYFAYKDDEKKISN